MLFKGGCLVNISSEPRHNYGNGEFKFFCEYAAQEIKERTGDHVKISQNLNIPSFILISVVLYNKSVFL
jgi:hypothetical protein